MTQAAKELHLTQSGVSQQIKSLEETLKITLFDRINRRIIPTSEAEILYKECSRRLDDLESALREISNQSAEVSGKIKLGLPTNIHVTGFESWISEFCQTYPKVELNIRTGIIKELFQNLSEGTLDFAFLPHHLDKSQITAQPFVKNELVFFGKPGTVQLIEKEDSTKKSIFSKLPMINYAESEYWLESWIEQNVIQPFSGFKSKITVTDVINTQSLTHLLDAVALLPLSMPFQSSTELTPFADQKPVLQTINLCRLSKKSLSPHTTEFVTWTERWTQRQSSNQ